MPASTENPIPNTIRVKLIKQKHGGLGFLIKQRTTRPLVVVADLVAGGIAEESGLVQVGDIILRLNDINLSEMSYESAVEVLKAVPVDAPVVMLLRGPEGYSTHLETTFLENGMPKTIRVTKPVQSESIMGRIRRTFSGSTSPGTHKKSSKSRIGSDDNNLDEGDDTNEVEYTGANAVGEARVVNGGGGGGGGRAKIVNETVLDTGAMGSPKIVLTSPKVPPQNGPQSAGSGGGGGGGGGAGGGTPSNGPRNSSGRAGRRAIEIVQEDDNISVVVRGDVTIRSESLDGGQASPNTPQRFVIARNNCPKDKEEASSQSDPAHSHSHSQNKHGHSHSEKNGKLQLKEKGSPDHIHLDSDVSDSEEKNSSLGTPKKSPARDRRGSIISPKKFAKLKNLLDEKTTVDVLHQKLNEPGACTKERCMGSLMQTSVKQGPPRKVDEMLVAAKDFIEQYFSSIKRLNTSAYHKRWDDVQESINRTGGYDLTTAELVYGSKTAWRNAARCIGRIQWSKLQVFDARHITTTRGMFESLCNHIKYATNKGNLRSLPIPPMPAPFIGRYWNGT